MAATDRTRARPRQTRSGRNTPNLFSIPGRDHPDDAGCRARLRFSVAFWSFTFPYAAGATNALLWISATKPPGAAAYAVVVIVLITALIAIIAARTLVGAARGQLIAPAAVTKGTRHG
jgi:tellurite resistance protein TehA-like permease